MTQAHRQLTVMPCLVQLHDTVVQMHCGICATSCKVSSANCEAMTGMQHSFLSTCATACYIHTLQILTCPRPVAGLQQVVEQLCVHVISKLYESQLRRYYKTAQCRSRVSRLLVTGSSRMQLTVPAALGLGFQPPGPGVPCGPEHAATLCVRPLPSASASEHALKLVCASVLAHCANPPPTFVLLNESDTSSSYSSSSNNSNHHINSSSTNSNAYHVH